MKKYIKKYWREFSLIVGIASYPLGQAYWDHFTSKQLGFENDRLYFLGLVISQIAMMWYIVANNKYTAVKIVLGYFIGLAVWFSFRTVFQDIWNTRPSEYWFGAMGAAITIVQVFWNKIKRLALMIYNYVRHQGVKGKT